MPKRKPAPQLTDAQHAANINTFAERHADPAVKKAADRRMSMASGQLNQTHPILHPIQFRKAVKERDAAVLNSREYGSGAKYIPPHGVT